ncbi:hypothetical protein EJ03DRAFT_26264 [Teratosphaeria nubilosa]|uniref:Uncharacterized protein n=1 Tax=Teratosphaeria nubilosa TaxID=161662 RepID=A0A6G1KVA9_9PEZI|nr:hypothetical protein EJ03DRAFT_26264 [Teratosphaeria nubilosa]
MSVPSQLTPPGLFRGRLVAQRYVNSPWTLGMVVWRDLRFGRARIPESHLSHQLTWLIERAKHEMVPEQVTLRQALGHWADACPPCGDDPAADAGSPPSWRLGRRKVLSFPLHSRLRFFIVRVITPRSYCKVVRSEGHVLLAQHPFCPHRLAQES